MRYIKLNKNWNAEPNTPEPSLSKTENDIKLTFALNPFIFPHIDENDKGALEFVNVYAYRLGPPNNEGYLQRQFRYKNDQLPWGEFYELIDSNWKIDFPEDEIILNDSVSKNKLRHFIFFLRDETFECLATNYEFTFIDTISEKLEEKYPKGYLNHYLAMFASQFDKPTIDNYKVYTDLYIQMESKKEFEDLKTEIKHIQKNNDLKSFVKIANYYGIVNFREDQLNEMISVIEKFK